MTVVHAVNVSTTRRRVDELSCVNLCRYKRTFNFCSGRMLKGLAMALGPVALAKLGLEGPGLGLYG